MRVHQTHTTYWHAEHWGEADLGQGLARVIALHTVTLMDGREAVPVDALYPLLKDDDQ